MRSVVRRGGSGVPSRSGSRSNGAWKWQRVRQWRAERSDDAGGAIAGGGAVAWSSPRGCSSAGRALRSQRRSRRFESAHLHQIVLTQTPTTSMCVGVFCCFNAFRDLWWQHLVERRSQPALADPVDVDVDRLPEGLVVRPPHPWPTSAVGLLAVRHQAHGQGEVCLDGVPVHGGLQELLLGVVQLCLDPLPFLLDQIDWDDPGEMPLYEASSLVLVWNSGSSPPNRLRNHRFRTRRAKGPSHALSRAVDGPSSG